MSLHKHIFDIWVPKTAHMSLGTHKFDFQKAKTAHTQACTNIYFARTYLRRCSLPLIVVCGAGGNGDSGTHASAGGVRETSRRRFLFYPIQQLSAIGTLLESFVSFLGSRVVAAALPFPFPFCIPETGNFLFIMESNVLSFSFSFPLAFPFCLSIVATIGVCSGSSRSTRNQGRRVRLRPVW
uniref:Uncharacterized protein n=1 Tax=Aegilops tauschii subsp. strangulata TaxID=200361 RepID=A0A453AA76_AEGTS